MRSEFCSIQAEKLIERLSALRVQGKVIRKATQPNVEGAMQRTLVIRFEGRDIERIVDETEFDRTAIGDSAWFSPPVPECDACTCHTFLWLIAGLVVGPIVVWAIVTHFSGRTAVVLSFVAAGWLALLVWARVCSFERNKFLRDLEAEVQFFEA